MIKIKLCLLVSLVIQSTNSRMSVRRARPLVAPATPTVTYPNKSYNEILQDLIFARALSKKLSTAASSMIDMLENKVIENPTNELKELLLSTYELYNRKKTVANYNLNDSTGFPIIEDKSGKPKSYSLEKIINPKEFQVSIVRGGTKIRVHLKNDIDIDFPENAFNCKSY